jgi:hypothetical protein
MARWGIREQSPEALAVRASGVKPDRIGSNGVCAQSNCYKGGDADLRRVAWLGRVCKASILNLARERVANLKHAFANTP